MVTKWILIVLRWGRKGGKANPPTVVEEDETMSRLLDNTSLVKGVTERSMTEFLGLPQPPLTHEGMIQAFASENPLVIKEFNRRLADDAALVEVPLD